MDAVELMNVGWNFRREHLRIQQRSHYVVTNGGDQPNVVPRNASVWYYFRETSYPEITRMWETGDKIAQGAAMMTDTTVSTRVLGSAWPIHTNKALAETMYANIKTVGLPTWTEADVTLAKAADAHACALGWEQLPTPKKTQGTIGRVIPSELPGRHWQQRHQVPGELVVGERLLVEVNLIARSVEDQGHGKLARPLA